MNLSDLRTALQERREDFSQSSAKLNRRINQAYLDICSRRKWGWLRRTFTTQTFGTEQYTVTATNASYTVDVTSALPAGRRTLRDKRVHINGQRYRVRDINYAIAPGSTETWYIDQPFIGVTGSYTATVYHDEVALPVGSERIVKAHIVGDTTFPSASVSTGNLGSTNLIGVSPSEMSLRDLGSTGRPSRYSVVRKTAVPPPHTAPTLNSAHPSSVAGHLANGLVYRYWTTHVDVKSGAESALSPELKVVPSTTGSAAIDIATDSPAYHYNLYRSKKDSTTPYLVSRVPVQPADATGIVGTVDSQLDLELGPRAAESASSMHMMLWPAPSGSFQVHVVYQREAYSLVDDADMPLFDSTFHHLILDGAEALMLEAEDEQPRANQARQRFEIGIARMIGNDRLDGDNRVVMGGRVRVKGKPQSWHGSWDGTGP